MAGTPSNSATPDTKSVAGEDADAATPPANTNRIIIEVKDSSWVEIRNASGAAILRQVLKPGDIYLVPNEDGLVMATGNAGGLRVKVDGKEIKPLGETGQIKRKIILNPAALTSKKP